MVCDRAGCTRTLCNTIIENQYICNDCQQEFMDLIGDEKIPYEEMVERFMQFLSQGKLDEARHKIVGVKEFFGLGTR